MVKARWCARMVVLLALPVLALQAQKKPWKDAYLQVGDIRMHYLEAGAGERVLVFIPGLAMPAEVWKEQMPYFSARGFRVLAVDPRSHGLTTKTEGGNTYHQQAADLNALLQGLKIDHPILVGWSAGVVTVLEYVSSPEALQPEKIVLVDGAPAGMSQEGSPGGMTLQQVRNAFLAYQQDRPKAAEQFVRGLFKVRPPELLVKELTSASLKTPMGAVLALMLDLYTGDRRPALARVPSPALVLVPPDNRLLGEYLQEKIPRSTLEVIDGAGHAMFLDKPQTFNQLVEAFLGQ